ncbi:MAG: hypothetical protein GY715_14660 [Planctomycetes bacterium]|nr:hypothetical protein [Planctomycetota bacterium]
MPEAAKLARAEPDRYETGSTGWVTARFTADEPMPKRLWEKWLDESYELSRGAGAGRKPAGKKTSKKNAPKKKATKKKTAAKKATGSRTARTVGRKTTRRGD